MTKLDIVEEQRKLVLARFKTLHSEAKLMLGGREELGVKDLIRHVENNDELGRRIVHVQIHMLKILAK